MARQRKQYLLRIPQELYDAYEAWAADEFRSVNAQMEAVLVDAARRARRLRKPRPQRDS
ncbi:MAG: toxin-antitoxin system HicB family antitoxin [Acidimicrobiia bacterium]|nr:toxin-antitoxin system HicB family antitoxin [Acidimicrobiia bacterium]